MLKVALDCARIAGRTRSLNGLPLTEGYSQLVAALTEALVATGREDVPEPVAMQPSNERPTVSTAQAAEQLGLSTRQVRRLATGSVPARSPGGVAGPAGDRRARGRTEMDRLVRSTLTKIIAAMDDSEFADLVQEARGDNWEPCPQDYRDVAAQLQGETLDGKRAEAAQALYDHVQGQKG